MDIERDRLIEEADKLIQEDKRLPIDLIARLTELGVDLTTLAGEQDHD